MNPNFLFLNRGDGTFEDVSEISGAAYNMNGMAQSGMGVDAEDVNGDGLPELFVTNFSNEYSTLYQNYGNGIFYDNTAFFGLASDSMPWVKWGCALADFDNDGWPDCFFVNGHVDNNRRVLGQPVDYEEIPLLFRNCDGKRFRLATRDAGPISIPSTSAAARPSATSTTTATSTSWSTTRTARRPSSATTPSRATTGSGSRSRDQEQPRRHRRQARDHGRRADDLPPAQGGLQHAGDQRSPRHGRDRAGDEVKKVVIRWPSGIVQTLENLKVDQEYKVVEPKTDPAAKHRVSRQRPAGSSERGQAASRIQSSIGESRR